MAIPSQCQSIADQLQAAKELMAELEADFRDLPNGPEKWRTFQLLKSVRSRVHSLQIALNHCVNPPPPLSDLTPLSVNPNRQPDGIHPIMVLHNNGAGPATGPFKITFGVEYISSYDQDPPLRRFSEFTINVPAAQTFPPGATTNVNTDVTLPVIKRPGSSMPALFDFYVLVDSENQVQEANEANNYLQLLNQPVF